MKKPIKAGLDFLYDSNGHKILVASGKHAARTATRQVYGCHVQGFVPIVCETDSYYRVSWASQLEEKSK